jgi:hypothetical protein
MLAQFILAIPVVILFGLIVRRLGSAIDAPQS